MDKFYGFPYKQKCSSSNSSYRSSTVKPNGYKFSLIFARGTSSHALISSAYSSAVLDVTAAARKELERNSRRKLGLLLESWKIRRQ